MGTAAIEKIKAGKHFYRNNFRKALTLLIGAFALLLGEIMLIFYIVLTQPAPVFYATCNDGKMEQLTPLDKPNLSGQELIP